MLERATTLWFKAMDGPYLEFEVHYPPTLSREEIVALLQKHAGRGVAELRALTGTAALIVQGQYRRQWDGHHEALQPECDTPDGEDPRPGG